MTHVLGLDISTTASKAVLVDGHGRVVASASSPHTIESPRPLWSEQDPHSWWVALQRSLRQVIAESGIDASSIIGVGLTGQMHGLVLLDDRGEVLRPAILWNDQRAGEECIEIRSKIGHECLVELTGNDAFAGFTAPKLLWVKHHEPAVYNRIKQVLLPKDFIRFCLTGAYATDKAGAGGTLFLDLATRDWSEEVLNALDIPGKWMPPTFEGPSITGHVSVQASELTGLVSGTPVVAGGGDQAAQAVGVGAVSPEIWGVTVGTSGVVFAPCTRPTIEPTGRVHAFPHAVPGLWHVMGVMLSAAGSLGWYHDAFAPDTDYDDLLAEAETIPPGCEGLYFQPYLSGERTPHADPLLRGAFVGLTTRHTRAHLTRAVLEGVAFGLKDNLELLMAIGLPSPRQIRLSGGGAKSSVWRQIMADILGLELETVQTSEGAAYGAALLAGVGADIWPSVQAACDATIRPAELTVPSSAAVAIYDAVHERHRALYPLLGPFYRG